MVFSHVVVLLEQTLLIRLQDVAGFDAMSIEVLRKIIVKRYMKSGFNNCRIQPLKIMYTDEPLELFVDPNIKPVAILKAAIISIHLKARV